MSLIFYVFAGNFYKENSTGYGLEARWGRLYDGCLNARYGTAVYHIHALEKPIPALICANSVPFLSGKSLKSDKGDCMQIDARGKGCPIPVMMTEEALAKIGEGIIDVLVDNEESALNVSGYATQNGMFAETTREGKDWKIKVVKGYSCKTGVKPGVAGDESATNKKTLLLIIGTDSLGKDEDLGKQLIKGFFDTMKVYKQLPHTIFFLNAGVKLTTVNMETIAVLKEIADLGVEIYSCGTCLKHYNLESELKVGYRGTTNHVVEGMQDFDKVVWV